MKPENLDSQLDKLNLIIDQEIAVLLKRGPTDLDALCEAVQARASMLITKILASLGWRQFRTICQRRLKRTHIELPEALRKAAAAAAQPEFDFHDIEQFRGVPDSITYADTPDHVTYIHYLDTSKLTRKAARNYLAEGIDADMKQLHTLDAANEHADKLTDEFGGDENTPLRIVLETRFREQAANE